KNFFHGREHYRHRCVVIRNDPRASWYQGSFVGLPLWPQNLLCQSDRSCPLLARCYGAGADQHFDSPVALPAGRGGFVAQEPLLAEGPSLDLVTRHSGLNQRVTNGVDTTFAQRLVVWVGAARIREAVDSDLDGRILLHVGRDVRDLARLVSPNVRLVGIEQEVLERGPLLWRTSLGLGAHRSEWTLRACRAAFACNGEGAAELRHVSELINAKVAGISR